MLNLVSTSWLADRLGKPELLILDASLHLPSAGRDARTDFAAAHIPGACYLDLGTFHDTASPVPAALPTGAQVATRLAGIGWSPGQRIVLYDKSAIKSSARAWFALRHQGIDAAILDGGLEKWIAEGLALETGEPRCDATSQVVATLSGPVKARVRTKDQMLANLAERREQVVDARDADRFTGANADTVHGLPGGHIPAAANLHFRDLYRPDGTFRPPAELRTAFEAAGIDLERPIVATCGSGVTASVLLFALHLIGVEDAALYDGSWAEWGADPQTPKETGPA